MCLILTIIAMRVQSFIDSFWAGKNKLSAKMEDSLDTEYTSMIELHVIHELQVR